MSYKLIEHIQTKGMHLLTYEVTPGFWGRLFGRKPFRRTFDGSGTVWYELPGYKRCSTSEEFFLAQELVRLTSPFSQKTTSSKP